MKLCESLLEEKMSAKVNAVGIASVMLLVLTSCGGSDNDTGSGNGNKMVNGVPQESRGCGPGRSAPNSVSGWDNFKQHVYNCNFDYVIQNYQSNNNNNYQNNNNYYGGYNYGYMQPLIAEYSYAVTSCDQYSGCYPVGSMAVSVELDPSNGRIVSIVDSRRNVSNQSQAHESIKNLIVGNTSNVRKYGPTAYQFDKGGYRYVVDLEWPMIANPVSKQPITNNNNNNYSGSTQGYWITGENHY